MVDIKEKDGHVQLLCVCLWSKVELDSWIKEMELEMVDG